MQSDETAGTEYDKLCDFENLYRAYRLAERGKREKSDIIAFELDLAKNLWSLAEELKNGTYCLSGYYHFQVHDPKTRDIQALYFRNVLYSTAYATTSCVRILTISTTRF